MTEPRDTAEGDAGFVERVGDQHFPWRYTEFGVLCACGRPCDSSEECEVVRRARRWAPSADYARVTTVIPPGEGRA